MTKMIKLSLAAALVATSAQAVEWSTSGKVYVESIYKTEATATDSTDWEFDADIKFKGAVADNITAVVGFEADNDMAAGEDITKATVSLEETYFTYARNGMNVSMGRTPISTQTTDGELVQGFWGSTNVAGFNVAAGFYNATSGDLDDGSETTMHAAQDDNDMDVTVVSVNGAIGSLNVGAESVQLSGHSANKTYTLGTSVAGVALGAKVATTDFEEAGKANGQTTVLSASTTVSGVALTAINLTTDAEEAAYTTDASSKNTYELVNFNGNNVADLNATVLIASMPVAANTTAKVTYATGEYASTDLSEIAGQVDYKFNKSTKMSVRHADYSVDGDNDKTHTRIDLTYSF